MTPTENLREKMEAFIQVSLPHLYPAESRKLADQLTDAIISAVRYELSSGEPERVSA